MTAHATLLVKDHLFTDEHIAYYVERAKGGVGVITMEAMAAHPTTQPYKGKAFAFDPRMVAQYRKIARGGAAHGAKLLAQPWHRGRQTNSRGQRAAGLGALRDPLRGLSRDAARDDAGGHRRDRRGLPPSARYAREGELDGVEVHGMAHGYLLGQFLSPATNHRTDEYGGSLENRLRIVLDILKATREETGPDLIVGVRINSDDGMDGGLGPEDWAAIARRLEATGADRLRLVHPGHLPQPHDDLPDLAGDARLPAPGDPGGEAGDRPARRRRRPHRDARGGRAIPRRGRLRFRRHLPGADRRSDVGRQGPSRRERRHPPLRRGELVHGIRSSRRRPSPASTTRPPEPRASWARARCGPPRRASAWPSSVAARLACRPR